MATGIAPPLEPAAPAPIWAAESFFPRKMSEPQATPLPEEAPGASPEGLSADPLAQRVATLNHEPLDHPMKHHAVVVRRAHLLIRSWIGPLLGAFRETDEILDGAGRFLIEQADREVPHGGDELRVDSRQRRLLLCSGPATA